MIVVKVGGSLFDLPALLPALRLWLIQFENEQVHLIAGGGDIAEAVRTYDRIHQMGEEQSHWLAIQSMKIMAYLIRPFLEGMSHVSVIDVTEFCHNDFDLPHTWDVTSDSIAARYADVHSANRLILLKSNSPAEIPCWKVAAKLGVVDSYFPEIVDRLKISIELVNFRNFVASQFPE